MDTLSHNARLQSVGESTRRVADRIVATWDRATAADLDNGARWYAEGETLINELAAEHRLTRETVAAVVAHLSPRTPWARNVEGARKLLATGEAPGCLGANVDRALAALGSDDPLGNSGDPEKVLSRVGMYPAIEHAYRVAAQRIGVDPVTVQATTWIVARNGRAA